MNINEKEKIVTKLHEFKDGEIDHMIQQSDTEILNYKFSISNYDEVKMRDFGLPFLVRLEKFHNALLADLERRTG